MTWYKDGLRFQCTQCGQCCTGSPGYIWVTEEEMTQMAQFLNISLDLFKRKYTRQSDNRYALIERKSEDNACFFLKDKKCMVYGARPTQCRTFPWWPENLRSKESWNLTSQSCEGINDNAPLITLEEINAQLDKN